MNRRNLLVLLIVLVVGLFVLARSCGHVMTRDTAKSNPRISNLPSSDSLQTSQAREGPDTSPAAKFLAAFTSPISYHGCVVDQHGDPVSNAKVEYILNDKPLKDGSRHTTSTDAQGYFTIFGSGLSMYVEVSKEGYYRVPPRGGQNGSFGGFGQDLTERTQSSDRDNPVVYVLYKAGQTEFLIRRRKTDIKIAKNGAPTSLMLGDHNTNHSVIVQCWTDDTKHGAEGQYNWRFMISVPNGGLLVRNDAFAFEAPQNGYHPFDEYMMSVSLPANQWKSSVEKSYFVRFNDNIYGRINVRMISGGDHFVVFSSYLNPKTGSRNLEADPKQR